MKENQTWHNKIRSSLLGGAMGDAFGAVCGNLIGAICGYEDIPEDFKNDLEIRDVLISIADDLYSGCVINPEEEIITEAQKQWTTKIYG